jgi:hypothetical protein
MENIYAYLILAHFSRLSYQRTSTYYANTLLFFVNIWVDGGNLL